MSPMQIRRHDGSEYLDVHIGEIAQLTFAYRKADGKPKGDVLEAAMFDEPHLQYTMRWYQSVQKDPSSLEPMRSKDNEKLYTLPISCKEGFNWSVHNSDAKDGLVLTQVAMTQIPGTGVWALERSCELEANCLAIDSVRQTLGESFAEVGDKDFMTTTVADLMDIAGSADGEQNDSTKATAERLRASRNTVRGQKAAATRRQNILAKKQVAEELAEAERVRLAEDHSGRDTRVAKRLINRK